MTSGIYKLTFSSGAYYIGKSVDIDTRWKQHADKLQKGTAAAKMQAEFNRCGLPSGEIIAECHKDHLDVMEAFIISNYRDTRPQVILNDKFPACVSYDAFENILNRKDLIKQSTIDHISTIHKLQTELAICKGTAVPRTTNYMPQSTPTPTYTPVAPPGGVADTLLALFMCTCIAMIVVWYIHALIVQ